MARLSVSASRRDGSQPSDMDLFLTLRHLDAEGNESKSSLHGNETYGLDNG